MTTMNVSGPRRTRWPWRRCYPLAFALLLATISLSACGGGEEDGDEATGASGASAPDPSPSPSPASGDQDANPSEGTPIRITFGGTELTARLHDNATARDLAAQLPLTLTFSDLNNVEKTAPLPRELSLEGAPVGDDPAVGDIGYWSPDGNLVFYYGDVGFWNYGTGIVQLTATLSMLCKSATQPDVVKPLLEILEIHVEVPTQLRIDHKQRLPELR